MSMPRLGSTVSSVVAETAPTAATMPGVARCLPPPAIITAKQVYALTDNDTGCSDA
jgi:hypothetical protein